MKLALAIALAFALLQGAAAAQATSVVTVSEPWVRPVAAHGTTRAFLVLGSSGDATLVAVRSPLAEVVLMRGRQRVDGIPVAAAHPLPMKEEGPHLAL